MTMGLDMWDTPLGSINPYEGGSTDADYVCDLGAGTVQNTKIPGSANALNLHPCDTGNTETRYYQLEPDGLLTD